MSVRMYKYLLLLIDGTVRCGEGCLDSYNQAIGLKMYDSDKFEFIPWHQVKQVTQLKMVDSEVPSEKRQIRRAS